MLSRFFALIALAVFCFTIVSPAIAGKLDPVDKVLEKGVKAPERKEAIEQIYKSLDELRGDTSIRAIVRGITQSAQLGKEAKFYNIGVTTMMALVSVQLMESNSDFTKAATMALTKLRWQLNDIEAPMAQMNPVIKLKSDIESGMYSAEELDKSATLVLISLKDYIESKQSADAFVHFMFGLWSTKVLVAAIAEKVTQEDLLAPTVVFLEYFQKSEVKTPPEIISALVQLKELTAKSESFTPQDYKLMVQLLEKILKIYEGETEE
jgi:predicted hydrocarbon binding protein